jgi:hypothetical protein
MPDGSKILPGGSNTSILNSNCGFVLNEQTGVKTYEIFWQFHLGLLVPSLVNLQPCLSVSNVYGKTVWDNNLGQVFQRADDGVANEDRPRALIEPSTLDPLVSGAALLNLVVKVYNYNLLYFGDYMDLRRRGASTDIGLKRALVAATIIATELNCLIWNTQYHLYRRGPSNLAQFWLSAWFGNLGVILYPVQFDATGDMLEDTEPPELLASDWCTKGENPIYLDLYPLYGRDATTNIYANISLRNDTAINPQRVFFFIDNPICIEDSLLSTGFGQFFKGDLKDGIFRTSLWFQNNIDWKLWQEDTRLDLKVMVCDVFDQEFIYDLGEICLYGKSDIDVDFLQT